MQPGRILRHMLYTRGGLRRAFPPSALDAIEAAVAAGERRHSAQLRFVVEGELDWWPLLASQSPRARALEVFALERVWDTEANCGVLLYVLMADRDVEIVADRGLNGRVSADEWRAICAQMERRFAAGEFLAGALAGVEAVSALLAREFPPVLPGGNELPDRPLLR